MGKTYGENEIVILFYLLFTIVKVGFSIFIHYFTLITNTKVSKMTCRHLTRRLWTKKLLKCGVFIWFSMVLI
jgi:hypothetical protein